MTIYRFHTPFVLRANMTAERTFQDEGFFVCDDGLIIFDTEKKVLTVVEQGEEAMGDPRLIIPLRAVKHVDCQRFRSTGGRFCGGHVCFHGTFDRGVEEKITVKMETSTYQMLVGALQVVLG